MTGTEIKAMIKRSGLYCWQVAEVWGLNDSNFSRRLRQPFNELEVLRVREIIDTIISEREEVNEHD
jgi:hypothetical protein